MKVYPFAPALIALMTVACAAHAQDAPPSMQQDTPSPGQLQGGGSPLGDALPQGSPPSSAAEDRALPSAGPTAADSAPPSDEARGATGEAAGESGRQNEDPAEARREDPEAAKEPEPRKGRRADREARGEDKPERDRSATKESDAAPKTKEAGDAEPSEKRQARETESRDAETADKPRAKTETVELSGEKRDRVRQAFSGARHARQSKDIDIDISIGQRLPGTWDLYPVPAVVVEVVPEYSGYVYAYVGDEYVICDPDTYAIVAVIDAEPGLQTAGGGDSRCTTGLTLSAREEELVLDAVRDAEEIDVGDIRVGWDVPDTIELHRFDDRVTQRAPALDACRYFVAEDQVAIVDPRDEEVVLLVKED